MGDINHTGSLKFRKHMLNVEIRKVLTATTSILMHGNNRYGCAIEQLDNRYEIMLHICGDVLDLNKTNKSFTALIIRKSALSIKKKNKVDIPVE